MSNNKFSAEEVADLEMLRNGDQRVRSQFFERYRIQLQNMARIRLDRKLKRRVSDSDIIQETFIRYANEIESYLSAARIPPKVWLRRLVRLVIWRVNRHHVETQCRDVRREEELVVVSEESICEISESLSSVGTKIDRKQMQAKMRELVSKMPKLEREILTLVHFEEQSIREAAMELGIKVETAKKRYYRTITRLNKAHRETLSEYIG